jgi:hypothetical protein
MQSPVTIPDSLKAPNNGAFTAAELYAVEVVLQQWAEIEILIYQEKMKQDE